MPEPISRRELLRGAAVAACGTLVVPACRSAAVRSRELDLVLRRGRVVDGSGGKAFVADVGVKDGRIALVGSDRGANARRVVDARGLVVAPGFIDVHAHTNLLRNPGAQSKVRQGVTLDLTGPDGGSPFPRRRPGEEGLVSDIEQCTGFREWAQGHWPGSMAMNLGSYVGQGTVRRLVMGSSMREPTQRELELMRELVRRDLEAGAVGLSSGLEYNPAGFAKTDEVIELAKVAGEYGRVYGTHMRSEDLLLVESVQEAIRISRESGTTLLATHLKAAGGPNWRKLERVIELLDGARDEGLAVYCDRYPYLAYSTGLDIFFPGWAKADGHFRELLADAGQRERMRSETLEKVEANGGFSTLMISGEVTGSSGLVGRRVDEIARDRGVDPFQLSCDFLREGSVSIVGFGMSEENLERVITIPYCMVASDGGAREERAGPGGHPRSFGTFPRAIRVFVREKQLLSLEEMIHKMTSLPAEAFGLADVGRIEVGMHADVVVFDPETITDRATYLEPNRYSEGVIYLLVRGELVVDEGQQTDALPGEIQPLPV